MAKAKKKYQKLDTDDNIVRRIGPQAIERDLSSKEIIGIFPGAMALRQENDEQFISVNWLEHCDGNKIFRLRAIVDIQRQKQTSKKLSKNCGFSIVNAQRIYVIGEEFGKEIKLQYMPTSYDPSYVHMLGMPLDNGDTALLGALVREAYQEFYLVSLIEDPSADQIII